MAILGRKTLKSSRVRMKRIDSIFEWLAKCMLIVYFLFTIVSWLTYRDALRIDHIKVEGAHAIESEMVVSHAEGLLSQKLLWKIDKNNAVFYPKNELIQSIHALDSRIEHVDTKVMNRKNLTILITEYTPTYLWCGGMVQESATSTRECFLADSKGYVYTKAPSYSGYPFPVFVTNIAGSEEQESPIGLNILPQEQFRVINIMMGELAKNNVIVREIRQTNEYDFSFITDKSWVLLWSTLEDSTKSIKNLNLVLAEIARNGNIGETLQSIDLRFGNKIFYK